MLIVEYNFRSYKAQTTPATLLVSVRDAACKAFSLDALEHTLSYKDKVLDLTVPLRFTSLVNGAKMKLTKLTMASQARIKLRLPDRDFVGSFPVRTPIAQILNGAGANGHSAFLADHEIPEEKTLLELGVNGTAVLSVRAKVDKPKEQPSPRSGEDKEVRKNKDSSKINEQDQEDTPLLSSRPALVSQSSTDSPPPLPAEPAQAHEVQVEGEPSIAQSQVYMAHLKSQATPKPMVSKSTQRDLRLQKRLQQDLTIRVRLPDMSSVEGVFKSTETGEHVYDFVRGYLVDPEIQFSLETVPPGYELTPEAHLVYDTDFDSRVLLKLKTSAKGPFLNDKALHLSKIKQKHQLEQVEKSEKQRQQSKGGLKQVPKWFKLGNK